MPFYLKHKINKFKIIGLTFLIILIIFFSVFLLQRVLFYRLPGLTETEVPLMISKEKFEKIKEINIDKKLINDFSNIQNNLTWEKVEYKNPKLSFYYPLSSQIIMNFNRSLWQIDYFTLPSGPVYSFDLSYKGSNWEMFSFSEKEEGSIIFNLFPRSKKDDFYWINKAIFLNGSERGLERIRVLDHKGILIKDVFGRPESMLVLIFGEKYIYWWEYYLKTNKVKPFLETVFYQLITNMSNY